MVASHAVVRTIGLAFAVLLLSPLAVAQKCDKRTALVADADVFDNPPRFVTGVGWRGNIVSRLSSGTEVYVCRETNVDFGLSSKIWVQIAYRSGPQWPKYGWVIKETLRTSRNMNPDDEHLAFFIGSARAATPPTAKPAEPDEQLPRIAPDVPAPSGETTGGTDSSMATGVASLLELYLPLFYAMLLGMAAKVLVDLLDAWDKGLLWAHLRNGVVAVLVSPIVFLGLMSAGQFSGKQQFVVLILLAFQNGFFWQTVLKRESDRSVPAKVGAPLRRQFADR
jgi:hypothetical protein